MLGPYEANKDKGIRYVGNNVFSEIADITKIEFSDKEFRNRVEMFSKDKFWKHSVLIQNSIIQTTNQFFNNLGAIYINLPLTTKMISSPGAVYGKEAINYTTDTNPIKLKWFDLEGDIFLAESSQIYLELSLLVNDITQVYSIYNSFRKENADATHLSEFHHIEYEGRISQEANKVIITNLINKYCSDLLENNEENLRYFLDNEDLIELDKLSKLKTINTITYKEALEALYLDTKDDNYKKFTMANCFGSWEEIRLTQIFDSMLYISEFPLLEVPFYHAQIDNKEPAVANNADIIWPGYRETIGCGHRVRSVQELKEKSRIFCLPEEDYAPYMQSRENNSYKPTSGFGLGFERLMQGMLKLPFIWNAVLFPRVHTSLYP